MDEVEQTRNETIELELVAKTEITLRVSGIWHAML